MNADQRDLAVRRMIRRYGVDFVIELAAAFEAGKTCAEVGAACHVSRQAAHIWRHALGADVHTFTVHPDIQAIADEPHIRSVA